MKKLLKWMLAIVVIYVFFYVNNHWLVVTDHTYESEKIPKPFDGFRITQVTDLHDATFGKNQSQLVEKVRATNPDAIFLTGDLVDSRRYDLDNSLQAVAQFVDIADVYYVLGNHEVALNLTDEIYAALTDLGVHVLPNKSITLERDGERIVIAGIEDPLMGQNVEMSIAAARENVGTDSFTLLLSHRPEQFEAYVEQNIDLVFSGHAHGGQIRLPFVGGLMAPSQGFLPTYTAGIFEQRDTTMIVSRGLGNSIFPFRIFNLPEIITVQLNREE